MFVLHRIFQNLRTACKPLLVAVWLLHPAAIHAADMHGLMEALHDSDKACQAADELSWMDDPAAVAPLIQALKHEKWKVRTCAAAALGRIGDCRACAPLIEVFMQDQDSGTRAAARSALDMIGCPIEAHNQAYDGGKDMCGMAQKMIDFISANQDQFTDPERSSQSSEWRALSSEFMSELDRLGTADPGAAQKYHQLFFFVADWADAVDSRRAPNYGSNAHEKEIVLNSRAEKIRDKETKLKIICPELSIPDMAGQ